VTDQTKLAAARQYADGQGSDVFDPAFKKVVAPGLQRSPAAAGRCRSRTVSTFPRRAYRPEARTTGFRRLDWRSSAFR